LDVPFQRFIKFHVNGYGHGLTWSAGLLTSCVHDLLSSTLQPLIHGVLHTIFLPSPTAPYLLPGPTSSVLLPVASHLLTGILLSPLDLVRTRLIVQSSLTRYRSYTGPIDALRQIIRDEGGIWGLYFHPHLLLPTILDNSLRPLISLVLPSFLAAELFPGMPISFDTHPLAWGLVDFASTCIGLLATLPFETVRHRLQVQVRGRAAPLRACVELRPAPYNGVVDALWHILTEERSDLPIRHRRRQAKGKGKSKGDSAKEGDENEEDSEDEDEDEDEGERKSWWRHTGLGQLYRGLGARIGAGAIVFVLGVVSTVSAGDGGWAEL
jgi:mitochondrial fusion and transport protein UGO1